MVAEPESDALVRLYEFVKMTPSNNTLYKSESL